MSDAVQPILIPWDSGFHGRRMGAGPRRLVEAGILDGVASQRSTAEYAGNGTFRGETASAFDIQRWLATTVAAARQNGAFPLVLAGNCISAVGACAGLLARGQPIGVIWFDAHADFNTPETSASGFLDGMALATLVGQCWSTLTSTIPHYAPIDERSVLLIGARDLDPAESKLLDASGIRRPRQLETRDCITALDGLAASLDEVYLHVDLDVLDEREARVNQYACAGGLSREELVQLVSAIRKRFTIGALALTAYDPSFDRDARVPPVAHDVIRAALH
jgi:arginase